MAHVCTPYSCGRAQFRDIGMMKGTLFGDLPEEKSRKKAVDEVNHEEETSTTPRGPVTTLPFGGMQHLLPSMAPVSVRNPGPKRTKAPIQARRPHVDTSAGTGLLSTPLEHTGMGLDDAQDAYDPSKPNDYEQIMQEKDRVRREQEISLDALRVKRMEKKAKAQTTLSHKEEIDHTQTQGQKQPEKGMTLAKKMLEKMGWKKGEGLGKMKQGISTALEVEKTDARTGRVVLRPEAPLPPVPAPIVHPPQNPPSRVIILTNVVAPGEVDESLDEEIGEECSKYGEVESVLIFEVTDPLYPADKAVRIFVQFDKQASAMSALQELNGRYFGGRIVRVDYFCEDRFDAQDLAPRIPES